MKRATLFLFAVTLLASSSGCCCFDRMFGWGCRGNCGYGHEGSGCDSCGGGGGGCGGGGCSDCGLAGGTVNDRGYAGNGRGRGGSPRGQGYGPGGPEGGAMYGGQMAQRGANGVPRHPAQGHPLAHQRRDADGEYEFAAGPPSGSTTYPYYTNRGPRDFLARNPRGIGP